MNVIAIDAATKTGWATNIFGRHSGITEFALKRGEIGRASSRERVYGSV